jgi:hypothetical protein
LLYYGVQEILSGALSVFVGARLAGFPVPLFFWYLSAEGWREKKGGYFLLLVGDWLLFGDQVVG